MSDRDELEKELEDTDVKTILADIAATNRGIFNQLKMLNQSLSESTETDTERFECTRCRETVAKDERQQHMIQAHNAPSDLGQDLLHNFKQV